VHDIVRRARRPIGSFYARFASKDALLPFLYQRYHDGLEPLFAARLGRIDWQALGFEEAVEELVDLLLGLYAERRWLIRALALFTRMRPESLPHDLVQRRRKVFDLAVEILMRYRTRIAHADPEGAIRFGVFLVSSVAREKLLFGDAPHSRVTPIGYIAPCPSVKCSATGTNPAPRSFPCKTQGHRRRSFILLVDGSSGSP
jgi:AcrR family transcriptional regulator